MDEFQCIEKFFKKNGFPVNPLLSNRFFVGVGDDASVFKLDKNFPLVVTTDMLAEGVHFSSEIDPFYLGKKVLAVNLSDLAAMGAYPLGFTLGLGLNAFNSSWLLAFSRGLFEVSRNYKCELLGGDTIKHKSNYNFFSVTAIGYIEGERALRRNGMKVGDDIWVSGDLGEPITALQLQKESKKLIQPIPKVDLGLKIREFATSSIDLSDGLSSDLRHLILASFSGNSDKICVELYFEEMLKCLSQNMLNWFAGKKDNLDLVMLALQSGDEYELCFSAPVDARTKIREIGKNLNLPLSLIGSVRERSSEKNFNFANDRNDGLLWLKSLTNTFDNIFVEKSGYVHF